MRPRHPGGKELTSFETILDAIQRGRRVTQEDAEVILSLKGAPTELLEAAGRVRDRHVGREIRFYYPLPMFPNISVTGTRCALRCRHCEGHYLEGMSSVETPSKLKRFCAELDAKGVVGILVSGGSDINGRVPLGPFIDILRWVKENTGLIVNIHTGLLDAEQAEEIASTGVDIASVDIVGSDETIRRVYGLDATTEDYKKTLVALWDAGVPNIVPHICVGLDHGVIRGEAVALEMVQRLDLDLVVILGLIPTPGTPMEAVEPPSAGDMARVVAAARLMNPLAGVALGCMRSRNDKVLTEELAIAAGVDRMVLPARTTVENAVRRGFSVMHLDGCCSIPRSLELRALRR